MVHRIVGKNIDAFNFINRFNVRKARKKIFLSIDAIHINNFEILSLAKKLSLKINNAVRPSISNF